MRREDKIGMIVGKVQIIGIGESYRILHDSELRHKTICKCLVCGTEFEVKCHDWRGKYPHGCRECARKAKALNQRKAPGHAGFVCLYRGYEARSRDVGREFELSQEEFRTLTQGNCHYCGVEPNQISRGSNNQSGHANYKHNGIDRLCNDVGYVLSNCVPCCTVCNLMKRAWGVTEFLSHIKKIALFSKVFEEKSDKIIG